jgi:hypothetical protein
VRTSERTGRLTLAIRKVQAACPLIAKTATVKIEGRGEQARTEKHAPHDEIWGQLRPHCEAHGLTVFQDGDEGHNGSQWLVTRVEWTNHDGTESEWKEGRVHVASPRPGFRDFGATWSYIRRVALLAAFGIVAGGDEPDQREADKIGRAAPPRANTAARPAHTDRDGEAEAARVLGELSELPNYATADQVNALSSQLTGLSFSQETADKVRDAFGKKRAELGVSAPQRGKRQ